MMARIVGAVLAAVVLTEAVPSLAQEAERPNMFGVSVGFSLPMADYTVWLGDRADRHATRVLGATLDVSYLRKLNPFIVVGGYALFEELDLERSGVEGDGWRYAVGFVLGARYPDFLIHAVLGGHLGVSFAEMEDTDLATGIEWGMYFGPEVEFYGVGLAVEFAPVFAWYMAGDDLEGMNVPDPRIRFRVSYSF
jgi:hypothetical protein